MLTYVLFYGSYSMSFSTVCRWVRKFSADLGPVTSAPKSASSPMIVKKIKILVISDARYTSQLIGDMVGISKSSALCFWRNILKLKKESTRWALHLLNEKQKCMHVRTAHKLLKWFPRYDQNIFMNVGTCVESWLTKNARRPCIAIRTTRITSARKVMYVIFFTTKGLAIQVLIPQNKSMNARFYKKKVLRKLAKFYQKR